MRRPAAAANAAAAAGLAAAAALHLRSALGVPFGWYKDDALHVLMARSILHGAFAYPDAAGAPAADPLPGLPLLLALPAALAAPRWHWLKALPLAAAALLVWTSWRLARALLPPERAAGPALLTALTPVLVLNSGAVMPDVFAAALGVLALERLASAKPRQALASAAAAALVHPAGIVFPLAAGGAVAVLGLAPWAAWMARNATVAGTPTPLVASWLGRWAEHAVSWEAGRRLAETLAQLGRALFWPTAPRGAGALLGAAALAVAGLGAWRLREKPAGRALSRAAAGLLLLVAAWGVPDPRYALPLAPLLWTLAAAALPLRVDGAALVLACLLSIVPARLVLGRAPAEPTAWPETMTWLRERSPSGARVESMIAAPVRLLADRDGFEPAPGAATRDGWLASLLARGATHVLVDDPGRWASASPALRATVAGRPAWAAASPWLALEFESERERTHVYRLAHPDPARYLAACADYGAAAAAAASGRLPRARALFRKAADREPGLATAWAGLAVLEADPRRRAALASRASRLDPTLPSRLLPRSDNISSQRGEEP